MSGSGKGSSSKLDPFAKYNEEDAKSPIPNKKWGRKKLDKYIRKNASKEVHKEELGKLQARKSRELAPWVELAKAVYTGMKRTVISFELTANRSNRRHNTRASSTERAYKHQYCQRSYRYVDHTKSSSICSSGICCMNSLEI